MAVISFHIIKDDIDYEAVLERIDQIFNACRGTFEGEELERLLVMVDAYQKRNSLVAEVEVVKVIKFVIHQQGLTLNDIASHLGGEEMASQIMSGKKPLTPKMIQALSTHLHIPIAALV